MTPRGIRNNNYGNIEDGPFARGLPGYAGTDGRFAVFDTPEAGMGAMDNLLSVYGNKGLRSVNGVINRWAPTSDGNNVGAYASAVANGLGVGVDDEIDLSNPEVRRQLALHMARHENGVPASALSFGPQQAAPQQAPTPAPAPTQRQERSPSLSAQFIAGGPGALFGAPNGVFQNQDGTPGYDAGTAMQNAGAFLMGIDKPGALSVLAANKKVPTDSFSFVKGEDGIMYRFDKRSGSISPIGGQKKPQLTPGEQAADTEFAKEQYVPWTSTGRSDHQKSLEQLKAAQLSLTASPDNLSGDMVHWLPDGMAAALPDFLGGDKARASIAVRDSIHEVVQRNLRPILGAQFTQQEGERLMARAFNPYLSPEENSRRLGLLANQISAMGEAKEEMMRYYEKNKTLSGYKGARPSLADLHSLQFDANPDKDKQQLPNGVRSITPAGGGQLPRGVRSIQLVQ